MLILKLTVLQFKSIDFGRVTCTYFTDGGEYSLHFRVEEEQNP